MNAKEWLEYEVDHDEGWYIEQGKDIIRDMLAEITRLQADCKAMAESVTKSCYRGHIADCDEPACILAAKYREV